MSCLPELAKIGLREEDEQALRYGRIGPDPDVHAMGEFLYGLEDPALGFEVVEPSVRDQVASSI
jgi:hypothetical protein